MATPMTGPTLDWNDSKSRGRRWFYFSIFGALAAAWSTNDPPPGTGQSHGSSPLLMAVPAPGRSPGAAAIAPDGERTVAAASVSSGSPDAARRVSLRPAAGAESPESPIGRALRLIDECQGRYDAVRDYVCTFTKRERVNGRLTPLHVMTMKARTQPQSIYFKFRQPKPRAGREAIYIDGRNDGKVLAHDVGLGRLIAGTLWLDPKGARAMEGCRHPITHAGIGPLLDTLEERWSCELDPTESLVQFRDAATAGSRPCMLIETTHPRQSPDFMFYQVRLYIDRDLGLPVRFEAYDWPDKPGDDPELVEEYAYTDLKLNVGLRDVDFDVSNADYAFGRF
jgi:Protein of unknown function (DUF1571)